MVCYVVAGARIHAIQLTIARLVSSRLTGELLIWREVICVMTRFYQFASTLRCIMSCGASVGEWVKNIHNAIIVVVPLRHQSVSTCTQVDVGRNIAIYVLPQS